MKGSQQSRETQLQKQSQSKEKTKQTALARLNNRIRSQNPNFSDQISYLESNQIDQSPNNGTKDRQIISPSSRDNFGGKEMNPLEISHISQISRISNQNNQNVILSKDSALIHSKSQEKQQNQNVKSKNSSTSLVSMHNMLTKAKKENLQNVGAVNMTNQSSEYQIQDLQISQVINDRQNIKKLSQPLEQQLQLDLVQEKVIPKEQDTSHKSKSGKDVEKQSQISNQKRLTFQPVTIPNKINSITARDKVSNEVLNPTQKIENQQTSDNLKGSSMLTIQPITTKNVPFSMQCSPKDEYKQLSNISNFGSYVKGGNMKSETNLKGTQRPPSQGNQSIKIQSNQDMILQSDKIQQQQQQQVKKIVLPPSIKQANQLKQSSEQIKVNTKSVASQKLINKTSVKQQSINSRNLTNQIKSSTDTLKNKTLSSSLENSNKALDNQNFKQESQVHFTSPSIKNASNKSVQFKDSENRRQSLMVQDLAISDSDTNQSNLQSDSFQNSSQIKKQASPTQRVLIQSQQNSSATTRNHTKDQKQLIKQKNSLIINKEQVQFKAKKLITISKTSSLIEEQNPINVQRDTPQLSFNKAEKFNSIIQSQNKLKSQNSPKNNQNQKSQSIIKTTQGVFGPRKQVVETYEQQEERQPLILRHEEQIKSNNQIDEFKIEQDFQQIPSSKSIVQKLEPEKLVNKNFQIKENQNDMQKPQPQKLTKILILPSSRNDSLQNVKSQEQQQHAQTQRVNNKQLLPIVLEKSYNEQAKTNNNNNVTQKSLNQQPKQDQIQVVDQIKPGFKKQNTQGGVFGPRQKRQLSEDSLPSLDKASAQSQKQAPLAQLNNKGDIQNTSKGLIANINEPLSVVNSNDSKNQRDQSNKSRNENLRNSKNGSDSSINMFINLEKQTIESYVSLQAKTDRSHFKLPIGSVAKNGSDTNSNRFLSVNRKQKEIEQSSKSQSRNTDDSKNRDQKGYSTTKMIQIMQQSTNSQQNQDSDNYMSDNNFKSASQVVSLQNQVNLKDSSNNLNLKNKPQTNKSSNQLNIISNLNLQQKSLNLSSQISPSQNKNGGSERSERELIGAFSIEKVQEKQIFFNQNLKTQQKSILQQTPQTSKLSVIAEQQQKINNAADMVEYLKLKNEIGSFMKNHSKLSSFNMDFQDFDGCYVMQYEEFRDLLKHLYLLDTSKVNPIQDYLIGQMWVKELQATAQCYVRNAITLVSAILGVKTKEIIIQKEEQSQFNQGMSQMLFNKQGQAKFKSIEDANACAKVYSMLSRQREEQIVEKKNQESQEKRKTINFQTNVGGNILLEVSRLDNSLSQDNQANARNSHLFPHLSPRSGNGSESSNQFSDIDRQTHQSRIILLANQKSDDVRLDLSSLNKNLNLQSSLQNNQQQDNNNQKANTSRELPSNEQRGFKSVSYGQRASFLSGFNTNRASHQREESKSKFQKAAPSDYYLGAPQRRVSGEVPKIEVGRLETFHQRNTDLLSKSIMKNESSDQTIRQTINFPANIKKLGNGKIQLTGVANQMKGKKKVILDLSSPDQFLNQIDQLQINPKFDSKTKMPVDEDSEKSRFGKISDSSKLDEMIKSVGAKISDASDQNKRPLLFMDVNLGQQKGIKKLIVYENDSPSYLAKTFGELHNLKEKAIFQLSQQIERKIDEALDARKIVRTRSKSPEIKSREPSPTDQTLRVVRKTQGVKTKSNTHGEVKIQREQDDDEEW